VGAGAADGEASLQFVECEAQNCGVAPFCDYESVYVACPPTGLGAATSLVPAAANKARARLVGARDGLGAGDRRAKPSLAADEARSS